MFGDVEFKHPTWINKTLTGEDRTFVFTKPITKNFYCYNIPVKVESLRQLIEMLETKTDGGTYTVQMGTENKNKLSQDELDAITAKGWTVSWY